ncbi:hypothetical protein [Coprothermobacter platensis]|uniref:hypothetical protein n=1 Tax=Coprothermobacter platensis TaxID=108819 RepID=UPI000371725C|nr:hypothetical protein [Coprothermobacter platensis]
MFIELSVPCTEEYGLLLQKLIAGIGQLWNMDLDQFFELTLVVTKAFDGAEKTSPEAVFKVRLNRLDTNRIQVNIDSDSPMDTETYRLFIMPYMEKEIERFKKVILLI